MKAEKYVFALVLITTLVCVVLCYESATRKINLDQAIEQQLSKEQLERTNSDNQHSNQESYHQLIRRRRYLEFPEGSSFQLVYDLIVGVVDFTNYLILGVTVALAWELPSKPPSEIFNDLSERLKDGTLGTSRNDTAEKIKYIDRKNLPSTTKTSAIKYNYNLKPMFRPPMHYRYHTPIPGSQNEFLSSRLYSYAPKQHQSYNLFSTRKQTHPFLEWAQTKNDPKFSVKGIQYPWWNLPERLKNSVGRRPSIRRFDKNINYSRAKFNNKPKTPPTFRGNGRPEHQIYPVFGKRSIFPESVKVKVENKNLYTTHLRHKRNGIGTELLSKLDRIHIEHHRRTRHELFQRIETYLNGRGTHGHHCVLKALCETGQKSGELKASSFVGELMRAIFTLPESLDETSARNQHIGDKLVRYDAANAFKQDCSKRYYHCKESLWTSHFIL